MSFPRFHFPQPRWKAGLLAGLLTASLSAGTAVSAAIRADRVAPPPADGSSANTGTTLPPAPQKTRATQFAVAEQPVGVFMRSGDDTLYVVQKLGKIRAWRNGTFADQSVLDISSQVDADNERGLLGLTFHPTRRDVIYIDYTDKKGNVHVAEIPFNGTVADFSKARDLLNIPKPFNQHNAGTIVFDPSGNLYVSIGDGGGSNDKFNNGQRKDVLLGKILRINPTPAGKLPYSIPTDNPFARSSMSRAKPEIFAYGLRNPWGISLDSATGDLWIPDVGENTREEINRMPKGKSGFNFGWKVREGTQANVGARPVGSIDPVYDYPHKDGRCAVVGGAVYRGKKLSALNGWYVFGDVCSGAFAVLRPDGAKWQAMSLEARVPYLTSINQMPDGELIATSLEGGLFRIE